MLPVIWIGDAQSTYQQHAGSQILWICCGGLSGRVPSEGSYDVQSVACMGCMGECAQSFGFILRGNGVLQCNGARVLIRVCCCLLHEVVLVMFGMQKSKLTAEPKIPYSISIQRLDL